MSNAQPLHMSHVFYISTGAKNARYTLRHYRTGNQGPWVFDFYIKNLADDLEKAQEKAQDYFDRIKDRFEGPNSSVSLTLDPEYVADKRRGKLSAWETRALEKIEQGLVPFGKHIDQKIEDQADSYILYFADKANKPQEKASFTAFAVACLGEAVRRDLITKRESIIQARKEEDLKSNFVGNVGDRLNINGQLYASYYKDNGELGYYINKIRDHDGNIIVYIGRKLGEKGDNIALRGTMNSHREYEGVKSTQIKRPSNVALDCDRNLPLALGR